MPQTLRPRRPQQMAASCSLLRLVTHRVRLLLGRQLALEVQMDPVMAHWDCSPRLRRQMGSQMRRIQTATLLTAVLELQRRQLQMVPQPHPMQSLLRIRHQQMTLKTAALLAPQAANRPCLPCTHQWMGRSSRLHLLRICRCALRSLFFSSQQGVKAI